MSFIELPQFDNSVSLDKWITHCKAHYHSIYKHIIFHAGFERKERLDPKPLADYTCIALKSNHELFVHVFPKDTSPKETRVRKCTLEGLYDNKVEPFERAHQLLRRPTGSTFDPLPLIKEVSKHHLQIIFKSYFQQVSDLEDAFEVLDSHFENAESIEALCIVPIEQCAELACCIMQAFFLEHYQDSLSAAMAYLEISKMLSTSDPKCSYALEKAWSLLHSSKNCENASFIYFLEQIPHAWLNQTAKIIESATLILQYKESMHYLLEEAVKEIALYPCKKSNPTCFIFYTHEEPVQGWLKNYLLPLLDLAGIQPLVDLRNIKPSSNIYNFNALVKSADYVLTICTPLFKQRCKAQSQSGVAEGGMIKLLEDRLSYRNENETVIPLYFRCEKEQSCPSEYLESTKGIHLQNHQPSFNVLIQLISAILGLEPREADLQIDQLETKYRTLMNTKTPIPKDTLDAWKSQVQVRFGCLLQTIEDTLLDRTKLIVLPEKVKVFTGRQAKLQEVRHHIAKNHRVAISGLAGVGKSTLGLQLAYENRSRYEITYWIDASSLATCESGLLKLADHLNVAHSFENKEKRLLALTAKIKTLSNRGLLIFDHADDEPTLEIIKALIPISHMDVIVTLSHSGHKHLASFSIIELDVFSESEAVSFISSAIRKTDHEEALKLSQALGNHPLAIEQATAYIKQTLINCSEFIERYEKYKMRLFDNPNLCNSKKPVYTIWRSSINAIESLCPVAMKLIRLCACLAPNDIPYWFIKKWCETQIPIIEVLELDHAMAVLQSFSILRLGHEKSLSIHKLLQDAIRYQIAECDDMLTQAIATLIETTKRFSWNNSSSWSIMEQIHVHIENCLKNIDTEYTTIGLCKKSWILSDRLTAYYGLIGLYRKASTTARKTLSLAQKGYGLKHIHSIESQYHIGLIFQQAQEHDKAIKWFKESKKAIKRLPNHPDQGLIEIYTGLGNSFPHLQRFSASIDSHNKALKLKQASLDPMSPSIAGTYTSLGTTLYKQADEARHTEEKLPLLSKSEDHIKKALSIYELRSKKSLDLASAYNALGLVEIEQKNYHSAKKHFKKALDLRVELLGQDHPDVAILYSNLGRAERKLGNYQEGDHYQKISLELIEQFLGQDHSHYLKTLCSLAVCQFYEGNYLQSYENAKKVHKLAHENNLQEPLENISIEKMSYRHIQLEKKETAEQAFKLFCFNLFEQDHDILDLLSMRRPQLLMKTAKSISELDHIYDSLIISENRLMDDHMRIFNSILLRSRGMLASMQNLSTAINYYQRANRQLEMVKGKEAAELKALFLHEQGQIYLRFEKADEATINFKKSQLSTYDKYKPIALADLASSIAKRNPSKGIDQYLNAIAASENRPLLQGLLHLELSSIYNRIGESDNATVHATKGFNYLDNCKTMQKGHPWVAYAYYILGSALKCPENLLKAKELFKSIPNEHQCSEKTLLKERNLL